MAAINKIVLQILREAPGQQNLSINLIRRSTPCKSDVNPGVATPSGLAIIAAIEVDHKIRITSVRK